MKGDDGFSLIESLVAFAILSLIVIVAFQTYALNVRTISGLEARMNAVARAKAAMTADDPTALQLRNLEQEKVDWSKSLPQLRKANGSVPLETIVITQGPGL